ncbi:DUF4249 family protein [Segatella bryantii]|uniref:DUF4249 family protein n=1 Tax=Segatella bryantii TaxID=77095 RepID=UPI0024328296|nr:DUF4249 family protein [Segatella bryantii]
MMMMKIQTCCILFFALLTLTGCEKTLDIDYHDTDPIVVIEGGINDENTRVRVTTTRDVTEQANRIVSDATVVLTSDIFPPDTLRYRGNGYYEGDQIGFYGEKYGLDVTVDGTTYQSTSVMQQPTTITKYEMVWQKILTEKMLYIAVTLQDIPNEPNYYFIHIYRNGIGYRWSVVRDDKNPGGELRQLFNCMTKRQMEENTDDDVLHDGDQLHIEVRSIDKNVYNYLYSLQIMDNTTTNPIANFTNGALGYFSAYSSVTYDTTVKIADATEE